MKFHLSLNEVWRILVTHQKKDNLENHDLDLDDFKSNPYTYLKWRFYFFTTCPILYLLIRTEIKPNHVSLFYAFFGILTLFFLGFPSENKVYIYIGLLLAFTKTIFDACDGFLARLKNQKSISGHMLDWYGAHVNAIGFQSGMGFYLANNENEIFFYLAFLIPFFYAIKLKSFAYTTMFNEIVERKDYLDKTHPIKIEDNKNKKLEIKNETKKYYKLFSSILDDRARSTDFIILLFILELNFNFQFIKYIFCFLVFKHFIMFLINIFIVSNNSWLEDKVNKIRK
tara:strand:- start:220 stop:1071 length:852 start_codon:yes stop_codon:yes gene_type:complete